MADHKDAPCLMGLPPELREMIWSFVVLEPHPIIAYVKRQTIASSQRGSYQWFQDYGITTSRQSKTVPTLPPLAFVAKSVGREVLPIFFSNTFLFSIDRRNSGEAGDWVFDMYDNLAVCTRDEEMSWMHLDNNITIRLEFGVPRLSRIATIEYTMRCPSAHGRFRARIDGQLTEECHCWLADAAKTLEEESSLFRNNEEPYYNRWGVGELSGIVERRIRDVWCNRKRSCCFDRKIRVDVNSFRLHYYLE
ncbi:hypothetical protein LTR22_004822 [Elasticomyces elasticus]|nr:hypothetical protein LTR22_004822 [Elasticomyces elasticus]